MRQILNRVLVNRCIYFTFKDSKRFAGHSKWQNIRHIKAEKDNERMLLFHGLKLQMKSAIIEHGSTKPENNVKLAQVIEHAKKVNMPIASIKAFLEKMESKKNKLQEGTVEIRGPNGYVMIVRYMTDNAKQFQADLNNKMKKCSGKPTDPSAKNIFSHIGSIIVEKKGTLEQATEDAIDVNAEDVKEFEENNKTYFQFKCDPKNMLKIKNLLERRQYCVFASEETYVPHTVIELSESDQEAVSKIREKVLSLSDVDNIYDNLA